MKKYRLKLYFSMSLSILLATMALSCGASDKLQIQTAPSLNSRSPESVILVQAFANLTFQRPIFMTWLPVEGDRLVVLEQAGKILTFINRDSVRQANLFLDISQKVKVSDDEGLLGMTFDPGFPANGYFYVYYSAYNPRRSVISRYSTLPGKPDAADPASEKTILQILQPADYDNHKGGGLAFGPDGKLYIAVGDGGGVDDPDGNAQNLGNLLGKILRIDPHSGDPYGVPPDNPYMNQLGARKEIWAAGFSNPYRLSFDRATGELWTGDNGADGREEIDLVAKAGNYGWNYYAGNQELDKPEDKPAELFQQPVIEYERDLGRSVVGGYVYRGSLARSLIGTYIYGDYYSGKVWSLIYRDGIVELNDDIVISPGISSFAEDKNGELYSLSLSNGKIYRFNETP